MVKFIFCKQKYLKGTNLRIADGFYYIDLFSDVANMDISNIYTENFCFVGYDEPIVKLLYD